MLSPASDNQATTHSCDGHSGVSFSSRGANMAGWWSVLLICWQPATDISPRICCNCRNSMNPAINPTSCSICRAHYRCGRCYTYPAQRQRNTRDAHRIFSRNPSTANNYSLHEEDSVHITVRLAGDELSHSEDAGRSFSSGGGGRQQPSRPPSLSGWW